MITKLIWYIEDDAVYIELSDKEFGYGKDLDDQRHIDYAADGTPIGVQLLYISDGVETEGLPEREAIEKALERGRFKVFA